MIYELLNDLESYHQFSRCRDRKMINIPGILDQVNAISEWDKIQYPRYNLASTDVKVDDENCISVKIKAENRSMLEDHKLRPGNTIVFQGYTLTFDHLDNLISLDGCPIDQLKRLYVEDIRPEFEIAYLSETPESLVWRDLEVWPEDFKERIHFPFPYYRVWKGIFVSGRDLNTTERGLAVMVAVKGPDSINPFPVELVFSDWGVYYRKEDFDEEDEELIHYYTMMAIAGFYESYKRISSPFPSVLSVENQIKLAKLQYEESKRTGADLSGYIVHPIS